MNTRNIFLYIHKNFYFTHENKQKQAKIVKPEMIFFYIPNYIVLAAFNHLITKDVFVVRAGTLSCSTQGKNYGFISKSIAESS